MLQRASAMTLRATAQTFTRRTTMRYLCAEASAVKSAPEPIVGVPPPSTVAQAASPRVLALIDEVVSLNMLEVKQLTDGLKDRLGIDDTAAMPMMNPAMFAGMGAPSAGAAAEPAAPEKTAFDLKLDKFDAAKKIAIIKEVRAITGLGLKEAKAVVEAAPKVFKSEVPKEEAEEIKKKLQELGAEVSLE